MKKKLLILCFGVLLIAVTAIGAGYQSSQPGVISRYILSLLDLPAARVDGSSIGFKRLFIELDAIRRVSADDPSTVLTEKQLLSSVWAKIVDEVAIRALAGEYRISVSPQDSEAYTESLLAEIPDSTSQGDLATQLLNRTYLREHIVEPLLLSDLLNKYLILNTENEARNTIENIYAQASKNPQRYDELLSQYLLERNILNIDTTIILTPADLPEDTVALFDTVGVGDITPVIAGNDGYRLYQVLNIFTDPEKAWQLKELFIPTNILQTRVTEYKSQMKIDLYAKLFDKIN